MVAAQLVALAAHAQERPPLEDLVTRGATLAADEVLAPLDAQGFEPDGCVFEVARTAARDRLEIRTLINSDFEHSRECYGVGAGWSSPVLRGLWLLPTIVDECEIRMLAVDPRDRQRGSVVPLTLGRAEVLPLVPAAPGAQLGTATWSRVMEGCVDGRSDRCVIYGTWRDVLLATDPRRWSVRPHVARPGDDASDGSHHPSVVELRSGRFRVHVPGPLWQSSGVVATLADPRRGREPQRLEVDPDGPPLLLYGAHAQAVAVRRGGRLVPGVVFGGELALVFDDDGAPRWARVLGPRDEDGTPPWSLLWTARPCAAAPPAEGLCVTPVLGTREDP